MLIVYYIYYLCVGQFQIMVNDAILIINYMLWIYTLGCLKIFHPSKISNTQNLNPGPASRSSSPAPPLRRCSLNFSRRRHLRAAPLLPPSLWLRRWTRARIETGLVGRGSICASPPAIYRPPLAGSHPAARPVAVLRRSEFEHMVSPCTIKRPSRRPPIPCYLLIHLF